MSQSNAAAIRRRAPTVQTVKPTMDSNVLSSPSNPSPQGLTLQQAITLIDTRLIVLESFMKTVDSQPTNSTEFVSRENQSPIESTSQSNDVFDEFNSRFEMLAAEIDSLKDIVLSLQSYTMSVNKTLLEERITILSDLGTNEETTNEANETMIMSSADNDSTSANITFAQTA